MGRRDYPGGWPLLIATRRLAPEEVRGRGDKGRRAKKPARDGCPPNRVVLLPCGDHVMQHFMEDPNQLSMESLGAGQGKPCQGKRRGRSNVWW